MTVIYSNKKTGHALERIGRAYAVRYPAGFAYGPYSWAEALKRYRNATKP